MNQIENILTELDEDLNTAAHDEKNQIKLAKNAIELILAAIAELREKVTWHKFENSNEEIIFFKELLPEFYARLIYNLHVFHLESRRPKASIKLQKKILQNELKDIALFFEKHNTFLIYCNEGNTYLDQEYFTRKKTATSSPSLLYDCSLAMDTSFCTTHSFISAQFLAFEKIQSYVIKELYSLDNKNAVIDENRIEPVKSPVGPFNLTELGYFLHLTGTIPGTLKQAMDFVGKCFDTRITNYSRILQQIRIRKGERATFLTKGLRLFNEHMDNLDEKSS